MSERSEALSGNPPPWLLGWRAAKANFLPGLILQLVMGSILIAYFVHAPTRGYLESLAEVKERWGFGYSALAAIVAGALVPEFMRVLVFQKGRVVRKNVANLLFTVPFWCGMGLIVDLLYRYQAIWFGDEAALAVVVPQVLVDQLLYNPIFAQPVTVILYDWFKADYRFPRNAFSLAYYRRRVFPALVAGWCLWVPVVIVLYTLPEAVQIPLFALALTLWVLIFTWMSEDKGSGR